MNDLDEGGSMGTGQIAGPTEPDKRTGWRRVDVWKQDVGAGDVAVGDGYSARYELPGTNLRLEQSYWIEYGPATNQPGEPLRYMVQDRWEAFREEGDDQIDRDSDYGEGWAYFLETFEEADKIARMLALRDESSAIEWREEVNQ